jgi:hypothetical protein
MKIAVLSESSADEAAIRILVDGIRQQPAEPVALDRFRARRGWQTVLSILPAVLKHLHYQTDAEALVVVLDSDRSPVHVPDHEKAGGADRKCRLCCLQERAQQTQADLRPVAGRSSIHVAIGLAVPTLEAWYRCGHDPHVTEAVWIQALQTGKYPYDSNRLKQDVYGTDRPSLQLETQRMIEEATRLAQNLIELERWFPNGFGALARVVRGW